MGRGSGERGDGAQLDRCREADCLSEREVTATKERPQEPVPTKRWVGPLGGGSRAGWLSAPRALGAFEDPECCECLASHPFKGLSPSTGTTRLSRPRCEASSFDQPKVTEILHVGRGRAPMEEARVGGWSRGKMPSDGHIVCCWARAAGPQSAHLERAGNNNSALGAAVRAKGEAVYACLVQCLRQRA